MNDLTSARTVDLLDKLFCARSTGQKWGVHIWHGIAPLNQLADARHLSAFGERIESGSELYDGHEIERLIAGLPNQTRERHSVSSNRGFGLDGLVDKKVSSAAPTVSRRRPVAALKTVAPPIVKKRPNLKTLLWLALANEPSWNVTVSRLRAGPRS